MLTLRGWQAEFVRRVENHPTDSFLLVACPAAGKTIAAAAGAGAAMQRHDCDQLVIVAPTVVVRDQWRVELDRLGYRMTTTLENQGWPAHVHGICATYAQVALRSTEFAAACERRRTVVVCDEVHHVGQGMAWGEAMREAFAAAHMRLLLSGTPFRSDRARIPWVEYSGDGVCEPDFAYAYPQAVRDGVCRSIEFRPLDGTISWEHDGQEFVARFSDERLEAPQRPRRLRASLDPTKPYLRTLLERAHDDLQSQREIVPDAAGLVVCDSQAHAMEVDRLLTEISGELPVLAMSDVPRAHQAIRAFATEQEQWIVSVRMVAEGVDIPRLGVIAWATASRTELMVRQVAGRALRGRPDTASLPAVVHLPADPDLLRFAGRLDVIGGVTLHPRNHGESYSAGGKTTTAPVSRRRVDAGPFLAWFDRHAAATSASLVAQRLGWRPATGVRAVSRWRAGEQPHVLTLVDACHMAGISFDELYAEDRFAAARAYANDSSRGSGRQTTALAAEALDLELDVIRPKVPLASQPPGTPEAFEVVVAELPPSPQDLEAAEDAHRALRSELFRLLGTYAQLRRLVDPSYQLGRAQMELTAAVGPVTAASRDADVLDALDWIRERAARFALDHPDHLKTVARTQRRLAAA